MTVLILALTLQSYVVGFLIITFYVAVFLTMVSNLTSSILSVVYGIHFPNKLIYSGSESLIAHLTFMNLISGSTTVGWKVISNIRSSCAGIVPFSGVIVKKCLQNTVSH